MANKDRKGKAMEIKKEPILEIRHLSIDFRTNSGKALRAVDNVSMTVRRGEIVGVIGESGSGKTTLASGILQSIQAPGRIAEGEILYHKKDGTVIDLLGLAPEEFNRYRWVNITTVFQAAQNVLNPSLRIKEHFLETAEAHDTDMKKEEVLERTKELFRKVRLEERVLESYPHQLSGGMKQRVIIALSLLLSPELLILDEPTTALDVITQWYILDILRKIHDESGITMMFCTHDVSIIGSVVDRIGVMYSGQLVEYGKVEDVFLRPSHPYAYGLMKAVPSLHDDISKRTAIPGYPPNLLELPEGCRFGPRCFLQMKGLCDGKTGNLQELVGVGENEQYSLCCKWKEVKKHATVD